MTDGRGRCQQFGFYRMTLAWRSKSGTSLLAAASAGGVELMHSCGGIGACTSCRVKILSGRDQLSAIGRAEREQLMESGILETHRLACQAMVYGNVVVERHAGGRRSIRR